MKTKLYVGIKEGWKQEMFRAPEIPTHETHGDKYLAVVGPFRTKAGAQFMIDYGRNNPHCRTVAEAEKLAKKYKNK
jgi:hypothetical protein